LPTKPIRNALRDAAHSQTVMGKHKKKHMIFNDYYSTLEISPQATQEEISLAYKKMAKKWHPDINQDRTTVKMQLISEAYEVLKNPEKRKAYNTEYYNYFQSRIQNRQETKIKIERCHYCGKNIAHKKFSRKEIFYKETNRTSFPQRKVWFKTVDVDIPRCEECYKIHRSSASVFIFLPLISFAVLGLVLGLTIWSMWFLCLIAGGFVGGILGNILSSIDASIIAKESGIKKESDISNFELVTLLIREGWSTDKPTA